MRSGLRFGLTIGAACVWIGYAAVMALIDLITGHRPDDAAELR